MKHFLVLPDYTYAGYCSTGGNKDWAACLAIEVDAQESATPTTIAETTEVVYLSIHGPHGGNLVVDKPKRLAMKAARAHFSTKCREKDGKSYAHVSFFPYLPAFGRPFGLALTVPAVLAMQAGSETVPFSSANVSITSDLGYQASVVKAVSWEKLQQELISPDYGVTEKVNGERCLLVFDGECLTAYNRKGQAMSAPPAGAGALCKLGCPFVIDGERLTGNLAGHFVAFDLLEWNRETYIGFSYMARITTLEEAMYRAGLLTTFRSTPTLAQARENSTEASLALLVAATGTELAQRIVEEVRASSGEGVIVRRLAGRYDESPQKFKFVEDIDAFVFAINEGVAEGSLKMGVLRPADRAIIEIANVRSGLTDADIRSIRQMVEQGERPVFTLTYLPIRTIGIHLVEPRTSMALLRSDKDATECTTDQFDVEKELLIDQAKPVAGLALP